MGIVHVNNDENIRSPWAKLERQLGCVQEHNFEELKTLFDITQRLILEHALKILNVSTIEWRFTPWMRSTLLHDKEIKWARAEVHGLLRFSSMSGKDARTFRSECKMERSI